MCVASSGVYGWWSRPEASQRFRMAQVNAGHQSPARFNHFPFSPTQSVSQDEGGLVPNHRWSKPCTMILGATSLEKYSAFVEKCSAFLPHLHSSPIFIHFCLLKYVEILISLSGTLAQSLALYQVTSGTTSKCGGSTTSSHSADHFSSCLASPALGIRRRSIFCPEASSLHDWQCTSLHTLSRSSASRCSSVFDELNDLNASEYHHLWQGHWKDSRYIVHLRAFHTCTVLQPTR